MAAQPPLPIGLLCALYACAPAPLTIREVQDYQGTFVCDDSQSAKMRFEPFKATLEYQGEAIDLIQRPVAKGYLYTGGGHILHATSSVDVTWTDTKGVVRHCRDSRVK
jgi:hypothetical protein